MYRHIFYQGGFSCLFLLLFIASVSAVGLSPARIDLAFKPNLHEEVSISLINSASRPLNATLQLGGDLAQYMKTEEGFFVIPPYQAKAYKIIIDFPAVIRRPGDNLVRVHAIQAPIDTGEEIRGIGATISVEGKIVVRVPYTGKYAEATLILKDINEGEQSTATFTVTNLGLEDIIGATGTLQIFDTTNTLLDTLTTPTITIPAEATETILLALDSTNYGAGIFPVTAQVDYDGDSTEKIHKELRIGSLFVNITDYTREAYTKTLVPFTIHVHNRWNNVIEHLSADIRFLKEGTQIGEVLKTPSITVSPWDQSTLSALWDTTPIEPGTYNAEITLRYHGKTTTTTVPVLVKKQFALTMTLILSLVIILMLLMDVALWLMHRIHAHAKDD